MNNTDHHKTQKELKPLIDGDVLTYRCGFAADSQMKRDFREKNPEATDEEVAAHLANTDYTAIALHNVKTLLQDIIGKFNDEHQIFLHGGGNFREKIATIKPYKGNRDATHKPKYYNEIKEYLWDVWKAKKIVGQESDDAMGIEQFDNPDKYTVICSIDKDMMMIPGWHYNFQRETLVYQPIAAANMFLFYQMLVGDTSDNIPGIDKIGDKRAKALIESLDNDLDKVREAVKGLYQKQYGADWERVYWEIGQLLYIRRRPGEECPLL